MDTFSFGISYYTFYSVNKTATSTEYFFVVCDAISVLPFKTFVKLDLTGRSVIQRGVFVSAFHLFTLRLFLTYILYQNFHEKSNFDKEGKSNDFPSVMHYHHLRHEKHYHRTTKDIHQPSSRTRHQRRIMLLLQQAKCRPIY